MLIYNDDIERLLFGEIDDLGARSVRAFTSENVGAWHRHFSDFFSYIDTQKRKRLGNHT